MKYYNFYPRTFDDLTKEENDLIYSQETLVIVREYGMSIIFHINKPNEPKLTTRTVEFYNNILADKYCKSIIKTHV
jgi:predicted metal-dependent TIM-barrel fold hydrolase